MTIRVIYVFSMRVLEIKREDVVVIDRVVALGTGDKEQIQIEVVEAAAIMMTTIIIIRKTRVAGDDEGGVVRRIHSFINISQSICHR